MSSANLTARSFYSCSLTESSGDARSLGSVALAADTTTKQVLTGSVVRSVLTQPAERVGARNSAQLADLLLQIPDPGRLRGAHSRRVAIVDVGLADPHPHRLHPVAELLGDPLDRAVLVAAPNARSAPSAPPRPALLR